MKGKVVQGRELPGLQALLRSRALCPKDRVQGYLWDPFPTCLEDALTPSQAGRKPQLYDFAWILFII